MINHGIKQIGLFGGTFNPVHIGHIKLAKNVFREFNLDKFIFIPSKIPPHKNLGATPPEKRFEMVSIAIESLSDSYCVSDFELKTKGISYTYKTLKHFRKVYKDDILSFITGSDIFATIGSWNNWSNLFDLSNFIVVNRSEMPFSRMLNLIPAQLDNKVIELNNFNNEKKGKIILHTMEEVVISSTDIRDKLQKKKVKDFLTSEVYNYIYKNKLYQEIK